MRSSGSVAFVAIVTVINVVFALHARPASAVTLGIDGPRFTLDGRPEFLLGASFYGALGAPEQSIQRDLADLHERGFNWVRVWATWAANDNNVSAVAPDGSARQPFLDKLVALVAEADRLGMVVDVTLSRGNGAVTPDPLLASPEAHRRAVETLVEALRPHRNVYIDVGNERNIEDRRHVPFEEVRALRDRVKELDPERLVTASHAGDLSADDVKRYVTECQLDFLSPHRPRRDGSPGQTAAKTRELLDLARAAGREVPVHLQEPFRRDFSPWQPTAIDFLADAIGAHRGGAAGWCFHNGSPRRDYTGEDRSFDMRRRRLLDQLDEHERHVVDRVSLLVRSTTRTWVTLFQKRWYINGEITCRGARAEGLLMNARMVNATFEDRNPETRPEGFEPDQNTARFLGALPEYVAHGMSAFTLSLQGGMPGYEGAFNSAFTESGELREEYLERIERVIRATDRVGACVILCCYYQRQDQGLAGEDALRAGVANTARWIRDRGFGNVILEIANEYGHGGFDHEALRSPHGIAALIRVAKGTVPGLLVSASGLGHGRMHDQVARAADFLLIHFNSTPVEAIPARIAALRRHDKAIVCNEDDKVGEEGARAAEASVANGASWGLMLKDLNQYFPFEFRGTADDAVIYETLRRLTGP